MNIVHFHDSENNKHDLVGGKGHNLINLHCNEFNVPKGFVVSTKAFFDFISENDIKEKILEIVEKTDKEDHEKIEKASQEIKSLILNGKSKEQLQKEITGALKNLQGSKFAVRSSSQAEDLESASFAGQQDTYLNVSKEAIEKNIMNCWASLFTSRAIFYREQQGIKHDVGIAVVVQEMIDADFAGVMFTLDPIEKKHILIEVTAGLGEKLVSGQVTPNTYFLHKETFAIEKKNENERFDEAFLEKIGKIGLEIEKHYGNPQDIEFAIKDGEIHILQARPITT
ncbi:PEP/pyruvate-binding domain-containing protein [Nanoarchaeota archaeon]